MSSPIPPPPPNMGPPPGYTPYGQPSGASGPGGTSGKAIAALVFGILNLVVCGGLIVPSVLAIVFGVQGRKEVDASGGRLGGRGMATAGLVCGIIGAAITPLLWWWVIANA